MARFLTSRQTSFVFRDTVWLGAHHDGHPFQSSTRPSFKEYSSARQANNQGQDKLQPQEVARRHAATLQSFFVFGLLEAALNVVVPEHTLLERSANGAVVLHCRNVLPLLHAWRHRTKALSRDLAATERQRVQDTLRYWAVLLQHEVTAPDSLFRQAELPQDDIVAILTAIAALGEALTAVASSAFYLDHSDLPSPRSGVGWTFVRGFPRTDGLSPPMVRAGWCPFTTRVLESESVCVGQYAATQKPHVREWMRSHEECTGESCVIHTIDTSSYKPHHCPPSCSCRYSTVPADAVIASLAAHRIPVLVLHGGSLEVVDSSRHRYVAISHVWSDGLGSTTEVGLPSCQVRRITALAQELVPEGAFWVDALCIPAQRDARKRAIGLMAKTYREAEVVLVIEDGIRSCSVGSPLEERLLRVLASAWMQRLWTLQEALLARKIAFQFADGLLTLDNLLRSTDDLVFNPLLIKLSAQISRLTNYRSALAAEDRTGLKLGDISHLLRWRATSRAEDETLAVAGIMDLDAFELANLPPQRRMSTFLTRVRNVPRGIVTSTGDKLNEPGFRWAPKTLMARGAAMAHVADAICTPNGLIAEFHAITFPPCDFVKGVEVFLRDTSSQRTYAVADLSLVGAAAFRCNMLLVDKVPEPAVAYVHCAAVLSTGVEDDTGDACPSTGTATRPPSWRAICQYQQRCVLRDMTHRTNYTRVPVAGMVQARSGRVRLRLT